jgi:hypothetical protein
VGTAHRLILSKGHHISGDVIAAHVRSKQEFEMGESKISEEKDALVPAKIIQIDGIVMCPLNDSLTDPFSRFLVADTVRDPEYLAKIKWFLMESTNKSMGCLPRQS